MEHTIYLVTGAAGFLGSHVCDELLERGEQVRALVLNGDKSAKYVPEAVEIVWGDLCDAASLKQFFTVPEDTETVVIHCASMVSTNAAYNQKLMDVNVGGTKNMINACLAHPECKKMVYVSSTGAIKELPKGTPIAEADSFTPIDEKTQVGCYSQSKALASQAVLDACRTRGLNACIVHPSGILGPKDYAIGETTGTVIEIMNGKMSVGMAGSFNLCDVRDLAHGCIAAADKGKKGECYILANKEVTLKEVCSMLHDASGCKTPLFYVPISLAYHLAAQMEKQAAATVKKPLMTNFSVYNLDRNNTFDYSKAERELGYRTRPYAETLSDMARWLVEEGLVEKAAYDPSLLFAATAMQIAGDPNAYYYAEKMSCQTDAEAEYLAAKEAEATAAARDAGMPESFMAAKGLIAAVAAASSPHDLKRVLHTAGISNISEEALTQSYRLLALSQDWDGMLAILCAENFDDCARKLKMHDIIFSQAEYELIHALVRSALNAPLVAKLRKQNDVDGAVAILHNAGYTAITADFLLAVREHTLRLRDDGLLSAEEIAELAGMDYFGRCRKSINLVFALGTIAGLATGSNVLTDPAFLIAIAGGLGLMLV